MRNLLDSPLKYNHWSLFILLGVISFVLLFRFNRHQHSVYFSSASAAAGEVYEVSGGITSHLHLKSVNEDLLNRIMELEQQNHNLEDALGRYLSDSTELNSIRNLPSTDYQVLKARVIDNSFNLVDNYVILNRGSKDGIRPEMGVVDGNGAIGIVYDIPSHYSRVISVLNSKSSISCKVVGSEYLGYLKWEYGDSRYAYLKDLPRHAELNLGDTVVTSGYSIAFPEGVMTGTVDDMTDLNDGFSYLLKVKLATDLGKAGEVCVIARAGQHEQKGLEQKSLVQ